MATGTLRLVAKVGAEVATELESDVDASWRSGGVQNLRGTGLF